MKGKAVTLCKSRVLCHRMVHFSKDVIVGVLD